MDSLEDLEEKNNCTICINSIEKECYETPYGHFFHLECLLPWLKTCSHCPNCKNQIPKDPTNLIDYDGSDKKFNNYDSEYSENILTFQNITAEEFEDFINSYYNDFINRDNLENNQITESESSFEIITNSILNEDQNEDDDCEFKAKKIRLN